MKRIMKTKEFFIPFEPHRTNRWSVEFPENFGIEKYTIKKVSPIVYDFETRVWSDLKLELIDPIGHKSTVRSITQMIREGKCYNFDLTLTRLGPVGDEVGTISFNGCNFQTANLGGFDWEDDSISLVELIIKFKNLDVK